MTGFLGAAALVAALAINVDETKVGPYALEDPLAFADGRAVTRTEEWPARRQEILETFAREMYGQPPPPPAALVTDVLESKVTRGGSCLRKRIRMWFRPDRGGRSLEWTLFAPRGGTGPAPVILMLNYRGTHELVTDGDLPVTEAWCQVEKNASVVDHRAQAAFRGRYAEPNEDNCFPIDLILKSGFAVLTCCYQEISPDIAVCFGDSESFAYTGVFDEWGARDGTKTDNTTSLGAWAWALSRGLDYAGRDPDLDAKRAVVTGYSRLGKAALLAAARDERFAVCVPVQTGGGGCPLAKRDFGETIASATKSFPHWYCRAFLKYADDPAKTLTFDQHLLLASIAPRRLLVLGFDDPWYDTRGEFLALKAASPAWRFLGRSPLPDVDWPADESDAAIGTDIGYARRSGGHGIGLGDWKRLLDFARVGEKGRSTFLAAQPVWPDGRAETVNDFVKFRAAFGPATGAVLRVTGSSAYRIRLNGSYVGYGPARGPKGFFRVDEWPLAAATTNALEIDVAGYNCKSYCFQDQPSFLQAEVIADGRVLAATGRDGAFAAYPTDRVRRVSRYSYQRTFAEAYRVGSSEGAKPYALSERSPVRLLERIAPYPSFALNRGVRVISRADAKPNPRKKVKEFPNAGARTDEPWRTGFRPEEFEVDVRRDGLFVDFANRRPSSESGTVPLAAGTSVQLDAGLNDCGFPGLTVEVTKPGKLLWTFDEVLTDGEVDAARMNCCNVIEWIFARPGRYRVEAFEPYVWRYANLFTPDGEMRVSDLHVRTYKNPAVGRAAFRSSDPALDKVFAAAKETFAQNAVDVFTDCPSRERAGWLCDSFFIGRVNRLLTGTAELERLFLQNYALPDSFDALPKGMVPMCYPADHANGNFIPNWAMWLVLETEEYLARSDDRATVEALRPRLTALVDYLKTFRNADGLLEKLPKWVFVEWSRANRLVQDVNYPSNMMWAEVLDAMDRLYGLPELAAEAEKVRETVRRQSWTGRWFCDNAVRQTDGSLKLSGECTETCQYYAFFFRTATPQSHPALWKTLVEDFGPKRLGADGKTLKSHPEIWPSNAFIGNYLRLECLSREGLLCNVYDETKGFFLYMAERTGTLWENITTSASCDHGFASHVAVTLYRDFLGVREIDSAARTVRIVPPRELPVDWCEGDVPLSATETLKVSVRRGEGGRVKCDVVLPTGWTRRDMTLPTVGRVACRWLGAYRW